MQPRHPPGRRGGIFTYYPDDPIVEWNLLFTKAGEARGFHFHKEFDEYVLVTSGHGTYVGLLDDGTEEIHKVAEGTVSTSRSGRRTPSTP